MRHYTQKRRNRNDAVRETRRNLVREVGRCEICGHDPARVKPGNVAWALHVHEIARGPNREKALDQRYAVLVLCWRCHVERVHGDEDWPEARQLAVLKRRRPEDYDLAAYNTLIGRGPYRITEEGVAQWIT